MCRQNSTVSLDWDIEEEEQEEAEPVTHEQFVRIDSTFLNPDKKKAQVLKCLDLMETGTEHERIASAVAKIYLEKGSYRAINKETGINLRSISTYFKTIGAKMSEKETYTVTLLMAGGQIMTGMDYYRLAMPYLGLKENHGCEVKIGDWKDIENGAPINKDTDLYVVNARPHAVNAAGKVIEQGGKLVVDIDDYWDVPTWNFYSVQSKELKYEYNLEKLIGSATAVTTTTDILAEKIRKRFKVDATVIKNCIHPVTHFTKKKSESGRVRFGWVGGVMHLRDISLMANGITHCHLDKDLNKKIQFCLGGYNYPNPEYEAIEKIFTTGMKDADYAEYLALNTQTMEHYSNDKPYRRLWGTSAILYGRMYEEIDVTMIPLYHGAFNSCKSELKVVEAATTGCAVIASDVAPYNTILNKKNSILINNSKPDWYLAVKKMTNNPQMREDLAGQLQIDVAKYFDYSQNVLTLHKTLSKL